MTIGTKDQTAAAALAGNNGFSLISNDKLLQLYSTMVRCRMIEERARLLSAPRNRRAALVSEAAAVGSAIDLVLDDVVVPSDHDIIVNLIRGLPLTCLPSRKGAVPSLANRLNQAANSALAQKALKNGKIVLVFSKGETGSTALWHRALANAASNSLPILFVCQSSSSAAAQKSAARTGLEKITLDANACGLPGITVDGSDVVAVYRVVTEAITHARKGNGATFIACVTPPSSDDSDVDPILKMEAYLRRKGLFSEELKLATTRAFREELDGIAQPAKAGRVSG